MNSKTLAEEKLLSRDQWGQDPCGAITGKEHKVGTRAFFDEVERFRYEEYSPWMPGVMGFKEYAGKDLLEVGCGMGTDLLQFVRGGARVTALDLTPRHIEISRKRFAEYGENANFLLSDAENLPIADESFDVVYSNGVLHHTPDTAGAIKEIHRVLRSGGTAIVMLYNRNSLYFWAGLMIKRGLLKAELLRFSPDAIMSRYVEYTEHGVLPLVKAYTRRQVFKLFAPFAEVNIEVEQITRGELQFLSRFISDKTFGRLRRSVGWNLIIKAKK